ncbi:uncharacterized protein V6R79_008912 [Siganus canaliculatus]
MLQWLMTQVMCHSPVCYKKGTFTFCPHTQTHKHQYTSERDEQRERVCLLRQQRQEDETCLQQVFLSGPIFELFFVCYHKRMGLKGCSKQPKQSPERQKVLGRLRRSALQERDQNQNLNLLLLLVHRPVAARTVIQDAAARLLYLLLLAQLLVQSWSRPTNSPSLCGPFKSMIFQVDQLTQVHKKLHDLSDEELQNLSHLEGRLESLPHIPHSTEYFNKLKLNESLAHMSGFAQSLRLHMDWLKTAQENVSLASGSAEGASAHLLQLSKLINASLLQIGEGVPSLPPSPSLPAVSTAFDVLQFSVEISEQLHVFCIWSKRVLRHLHKQSRCPRH